MPARVKSVGDHNDRLDHIKKRRTEGASFGDIGVELGVSRQRVHQLLKEG